MEKPGSAERRARHIRIQSSLLSSFCVRSIRAPLLGRIEPCRGGGILVNPCRGPPRFKPATTLYRYSTDRFCQKLFSKKMQPVCLCEVRVECPRADLAGARGGSGGLAYVLFHMERTFPHGGMLPNPRGSKVWWLVRGASRKAWVRIWAVWTPLTSKHVLRSIGAS